MDLKASRVKIAPVWPGFLCLLIVGIFASPLQAREAAARVQFAVGDVAAISTDGSARRLQKGDRIYPGDTVKTGEQGSAQLIYRDRSRMAVRVNTEFKIKEYKYDANNEQGSISVFQLLGGALRSVSGLIGAFNPQRVTIETPIATIGIRGTDHETVFLTRAMEGLKIDADVGVYEKVYAGATIVRTAKGNLNLDLNETGFVGGSSRADVVRPVKLKDLPASIKSQIINKIPVQAKTLPKNNQQKQAVSRSSSGASAKSGSGGAAANPDLTRMPSQQGISPEPYPGSATSTSGARTAPSTLQKSFDTNTAIPSSRGGSTTVLQKTLNPPSKTIIPQVPLPTTKIAPKATVPVTITPKVSIPTTAPVSPKVSVPKTTTGVTPRLSTPKTTPSASVPKSATSVTPKVAVPKASSKVTPKVPATRSTKTLPKKTLPTTTLPKTLKKP